MSFGLGSQHFVARNNVLLSASPDTEHQDVSKLPGASRDGMKWLCHLPVPLPKATSTKDKLCSIISQANI